MTFLTKHQKCISYQNSSHKQQHLRFCTLTNQTNNNASFPHLVVSPPVVAHLGDVVLVDADDGAVGRHHLVLDDVLGPGPVAVGGPGDVDPAAEEISADADVQALAVHQGKLESERAIAAIDEFRGDPWRQWYFFILTFSTFI